MNANERQIGGAHYGRAAVQHWDIVASAMGGDYFMGNATKYVARHRKKNGLQDLEKAMHYLDKAEELFNAGKLKSRFAAFDLRNVHPDVYTFIRLNEFNELERAFIERACVWVDAYDLTGMRALLHMLSRVALGAAEPGRGYVDQG